VTSAALWTRLLDKLGAEVSVHVPHRRRDGYDMQSAFVEQARQDGVKLIVTTDCGIQRTEEVEEAREAGIDVIVTDHHEPGESLPRAVAVVNPHRKDSSYPFPHLAGVGVAFRTGEAVLRHLGMPVDSYRERFSDLAAIGTVTDIMPVLGENRVIVKEGLKRLGATKKEGLRALIQASGANRKPITAHTIGFVLGPRLNAVGRVDDAKVALDLLLSRDRQECHNLAQQLEEANQERRATELAILEQALALAEAMNLEETGCLVLHAEGWHTGVIGIVASRIVERFCRPAVLISLDTTAGTGRGSARSIRAFNLYNAIDECGELLLGYGGHSHAAGFTIEPGSVEPFRERMNAIARSRLAPEDFIPTLDIEMELGPEALDQTVLAELASFEPWGHENREPLFLTRDLKVVGCQKVGQEGQHLKLRVRANGSGPFDAMLWNRGDELCGRLLPSAREHVSRRNEPPALHRRPSAGGNGLAPPWRR
jgi:single-stranded-DNA-specific exonuclease